MPQLDLLTFLPQIFWLSICFALLYIILGRICLPKLVDNVQARDKKIFDALALAEHNKNEALRLSAESKKLLEEASSKKDELLSKAMNEISKMIESRLEENNNKLTLMINDSEKRLEDFRQSSSDEINQIAVKATQAILSTLFELKVGEAEIKTHIGNFNKVEKYDA